MHDNMGVKQLSVSHTLVSGINCAYLIDVQDYLNISKESIDVAQQQLRLINMGTLSLTSMRFILWKHWDYCAQGDRRN
jgi:hypothetical protein